MQSSLGGLQFYLFDTALRNGAQMNGVDLALSYKPKFRGLTQ